MRPETALPTYTPQADGRLAGKNLALVVAILGCCLLVAVGYHLFRKEAQRGQMQSSPQPAESEMSKPLSGPDPSLKLPASYAGWDRSATTTPPIPVAQRVQASGKHEEPPLVRGQVPQGQSTTTPPAQSRPRTSQPTAADKPKVPRYLFAKGTDAVGKSPFGEPEKGQGMPQGPGAPGSGSLIKDATWERPRDETRTWYMSQGLEGVTTTELVSDLPGQVVIRTTRDLEDKLLQGRILIPQQSLVIGEQTGHPSFGMSRLAVTLKQVEYPDGAVLALTSKVADGEGATGLQGHTDYHIGRLLASVGLSAILSIGTRIPTGNTEGYVPTLGQQTTQQLGQDIARSGNRIVERELAVAPTVTIPMGTAVTIHPEANLSFSHPPKVVR